MNHTNRIMQRIIIVLVILQIDAFTPVITTRISRVQLHETTEKEKLVSPPSPPSPSPSPPSPTENAVTPPLSSSLPPKSESKSSVTWFGETTVPKQPLIPEIPSPLSKISLEVTNSITTPQIEKSVPKKILGGSALFYTASAFILTQSAPLALASGIIGSYLSIKPGVVGDVSRGVGNVFAELGHNFEEGFVETKNRVEEEKVKSLLESGRVGFEEKRVERFRQDIKRELAEAEARAEKAEEEAKRAEEEMLMAELELEEVMKEEEERNRGRQLMGEMGKLSMEKKSIEDNEEEEAEIDREEAEIDGEEEDDATTGELLSEEVTTFATGDELTLSDNNNDDEEDTQIPIDEKEQWQAAKDLAKELAKKDEAQPNENEDMETITKMARAAVDEYKAQKQQQSPTPKDVTDTTTESIASVAEYTKLTVVKLKDELRERGLKVSGRKQELIDRLLEHDAMNQ